MSDAESRLRAALRDAATVGEALEILERLLGSGLTVGPSGRLLHTRALVDRVNGLRIEIYPNDHAPPHFHLRSPQCHAKFAISTCESLGSRVPSRVLELVQVWYREGGRRLLIQEWNRLRPTDGPRVVLEEDAA